MRLAFALATCAVAMLPVSAAAQPYALVRAGSYAAAPPASGFAQRCMIAGDLVRPWIVFADPEAAFNGTNSGRVWVYSYFDSLAPEYVVDGAAGDHLGASLGSASIDGDYYPDLLIGAPGSPDVDASATGKVVVVFGGSALGTRPALEIAGAVPGGRFGAAVAGLSAARGAGYWRETFAVGAPDENAAAGAVYVYRLDSLTNIAPLRVLAGEAAGDRFGAALGNAGRTHSGAYADWRVADLLVGAPGNSATAAGAGRAYLFRGDGYQPPSATPIVTWSGEAAGDHFGAAVAGGGDFGWLGHSVALVGAPDADAPGAIAAGRAYVFATGGAPVPVQSTTYTGAETGRHLGAAVEVVLDGGTGEGALLIGGPGEPAGVLAGEVQFHDLHLQAPADTTLAGQSPGDGFGTGVASGWQRSPCDGCPHVPLVLAGAPAIATGGTGYLFTIRDTTTRRLDASVPGPTRARLLDPAPNPVRGTARLGFTLERAGRARLEILDLAGRREAAVADGEFAAGTHVFAWNAAGGAAANDRAAPGIRWVVLTTTQGRDVRRVIVLR